MASTSDSTSHWSVVTPGDTAASNFRTDGSSCNYIYVGVAGNVTAICDGVAILFANLAVGYHPIRCSRINNIATTATSMLVAF